MKEYDLLIVGAGAAGMSCARSAYENGIRSILLVDKEENCGGILNQCIHNGFGLHTFNEELSGPGFAERCFDRISDLGGIELKMGTSVMDVSEDLTVSLQSPMGYEKVQVKALCIASGCRERSGGAISLKGDRCQGIYTAGAAQKYLNMNGQMVGKKVFILGSGDIGLIMARRMSLEGAEVVGVAEIQPYSNGLARNIKQCLEDFDIPLYLSHTVVSCHGDPRLKSIILAPVDEKMQPIMEKAREIEVDCLLLSIGLIPDNTILEKLHAVMDPKTKGPVVDDCYMTSVPGIFACGNALHVHDLVDFVYIEAEKCGRSISEYILGNRESKAGAVSKAINGVSYVIPQKISLDKDVEFAFRVSRVYKKAKIHVYGQGLDKRIPKISLVPSEMVKVTLKKEELEGLSGELFWEVEA